MPPMDWLSRQSIARLRSGLLARVVGVSNSRRTPRDERAWQAYGTVLGQRLRAAREAHGLSQHELADAAGVSSNTVKNVENVVSSTAGLPGSTTVRTLVRLAGALGIPPTLLLPSLGEVPPSDPGVAIDLVWPADEVYLAQVRRHPLPPTTEAARRRRA